MPTADIILATLQAMLWFIQLNTLSLTITCTRTHACTRAPTPAFQQCYLRLSSCRIISGYFVPLICYFVSLIKQSSDLREISCHSTYFLLNTCWVLKDFWDIRKERRKVATEIYLSGEAKTVHRTCCFLTINGSVLSMTTRGDGYVIHQILSCIRLTVAAFLAAECPFYFLISNLSPNL